MGEGRITSPFTEHEWEGLAAAILCQALYDTRHPTGIAALHASQMGYSSLREELIDFWGGEWAAWLCEWFSDAGRALVNLEEIQALLQS